MGTGGMGRASVLLLPAGCRGARAVMSTCPLLLCQLHGGEDTSCMQREACREGTSLVANRISISGGW